jgi:hypothetical protein
LFNYVRIGDKIETVAIHFEPFIDRHGYLIEDLGRVIIPRVEDNAGFYMKGSNARGRKVGGADIGALASVGATQMIDLGMKVRITAIAHDSEISMCPRDAEECHQLENMVT